MLGHPVLVWDAEFGGFARQNRDISSNFTESFIRVFILIRAISALFLVSTLVLLHFDFIAFDELGTVTNFGSRLHSSDKWLSINTSLTENATQMILIKGLSRNG